MIDGWEIEDEFELPNSSSSSWSSFVLEFFGKGKALGRVPRSRLSPRGNALANNHQ